MPLSIYQLILKNINTFVPISYLHSTVVFFFFFLSGACLKQLIISNLTCLCKDVTVFPLQCCNVVALYVLIFFDHTLLSVFLRLGRNVLYCTGKPLSDVKCIFSTAIDFACKSLISGGIGSCLAGKYSSQGGAVS